MSFYSTWQQTYPNKNIKRNHVWLPVVDLGASDTEIQVVLFHGGVSRVLLISGKVQCYSQFIYTVWSVDVNTWSLRINQYILDGQYKDNFTLPKRSTTVSLFSHLLTRYKKIMTVSIAKTKDGYDCHEKQNNKKQQQQTNKTNKH